MIDRWSIFMICMIAFIFMILVPKTKIFTFRYTNIYDVRFQFPWVKNGALDIGLAAGDGCTEGPGAMYGNLGFGGQQKCYRWAT